LTNSLMYRIVSSRKRRWTSRRYAPCGAFFVLHNSPKWWLLKESTPRGREVAISRNMFSQISGCHFLIFGRICLDPAQNFFFSIITHRQMPAGRIRWF
jgi:hypothetical protein